MDHNAESFLDKVFSSKDEVIAAMVVFNESRQQACRVQTSNTTRLTLRCASHTPGSENNCCFKVIARKEEGEDLSMMWKYFILESYLNNLRIADSGASVYFQTISCPWRPTLAQFHRCYVALSTSKLAWECGCIRIVIADGTFSKGGHFQQTLLLAVAFDGNNEIVLLALSIVDVENEDNWTWFVRHITDDFPNIDVFVADYDKGIQSNAFQDHLRDRNISFSRCAKHLASNCKTHASIGKKTELFIASHLAKARTEANYNACLDFIRKENNDAADWLERHKQQFVTVAFLDQQPPRCRHGKVTNNAAENTNSAILSERACPITEMVAGIIGRSLRKSHEAKVKAQHWIQKGQELTNYASKKHTRTIDDARKLRTTVVSQNGHSWRGQVAVSPATAGPPGMASIVTVDVEVNSESFTCKCPCRWTEERRMPCYHAMALIINADLEPNNPNWYCTLYHATTVENMYMNTTRLDGDLSTMGNLEVRELALPKGRARAGRPKMKRYTTSGNSTAGQCGGCGIVGHRMSTCPKPNTQYQYQQNIDKAMKYATSLVSNFGSRN
ncbi:hypothetical protein MHU86_20507 [Fragilaria crotonensis]|nr:hypothetical protein MHU86_20507 [Fragilaria crotonensis]